MALDKVGSRIKSMLGAGSSSPKIEEIEIEIEPKDMMMESASEDLISAVEEKDAKAVASAFRAMFEALMEAGPEEKEDDNDEDDYK